MTDEIKKQHRERMSEQRDYIHSQEIEYRDKQAAIDATITKLERNMTNWSELLLNMRKTLRMERLLDSYGITPVYDPEMPISVTVKNGFVISITHDSHKIILRNPIGVREWEDLYSAEKLVPSQEVH